MQNLPAKNWRMQKSKYTLLGARCLKCKLVTYPSKTICPKCGAIGKSRDFMLEPHGKIISFSEIYIAPYGFDKFTPYVIVLVKMKNGPVVFSQLTDYLKNDMKIGRKVVAVLRKISDFEESGIIQYGIKFKPV